MSLIGSRFDFHGRDAVDLKTAFQVRSAYRNEADFQIDHLQASPSKYVEPRFDRIIDADVVVAENYNRIAWRGLHDLFQAERLTPHSKNTAVMLSGELQRAMSNLFADPELLLQDFGAMESKSFRFRKGSVNDFHYKNLSGGEKAAFDLLARCLCEASRSKGSGVPNRVFWTNTYKMALDDLASLVAPACIVVCEGNQDKHVKGFDADCYNRIFSDEYPETLFMSRGGASQVVRSEHLVTILKAIAEGIEVRRLIDRDDMTEDERNNKIKSGSTCYGAGSLKITSTTLMYCARLWNRRSATRKTWTKFFVSIVL